MASFQADVLDHLAQVVGGTKSPNDAHFFSGNLANDGTGVAGLKGCYSAAPNGIQTTPVGIVMIGPFKAEQASQGEEDNVDEVRILVLVAAYDSESQIAALTPFRDSVPAAFRAHRQAFAMPGAISCLITSGTPGIHVWGATPYAAIEFICTVNRMMAVTYQP